LLPAARVALRRRSRFRQTITIPQSSPSRARRLDRVR
jgi:hypothetical protein